jgi:putative membrane protein
MTTIPLRRIQTLTVRETPLHRLARRVAVRAQTAGGGATDAGDGRRRPREREWLAPLVRRSALPALVAQIMPELDFEAVVWQPVHPRAFRRAMKPSLLLAAIVTALLAWPLGWLSLFVLVFLSLWAVVSARHHVRHLGWARDDHLVLFKSGWLWRQTTIARIVKIQAVTLAESPFDRRSGMAQVRVDTAGAAEGTHRVRIPYLGRAVAESLRRQLAAQAATTAFRW